MAGLTDALGKSVYGRLFEIEGKDWLIIHQHKEGAVTSMSVERVVLGRVEGQELQATALVMSPRRSTEGPISQRVIEALVRGAESAGLSVEYIERLCRGE